MPSWQIRARPPRGDLRTLRIVRDADQIAAHCEDAAHFSGGHAAAIALPQDEAGVADVLRAFSSVLPIGAQSSLTGGATPMGEVLLATSHLNRIHHADGAHIRAEPGVTLAALDEALSRIDHYYPPSPTFTGACVGGTIATNAAGAATFKYGTTRQWVDALTVVLATGDVLDIERGQTRAHPDGYFEIHLSSGTVRVPVPGYRMPSLPKLSAGYFAEPGMDLIDLFIGSEGTLGVVMDATLRLVTPRPWRALAFVPFSSRSSALRCAALLRAHSQDAWRSRNTRGLDVSAIEHMDRRAIALLRDEGADRQNGLAIPAETDTALIVTLDLPPGTSAEQAYEDIAGADHPDSADRPLARFCRVVAETKGTLDDVAIAVPGDRVLTARLVALREAVPEIVNRRVGTAKRDVDRRIEKVAGDNVVPVDALDAFLTFCDDEFARRGLEAASWGHVSDGNLHPNVLPRSYADVENGRAALLSIGREAIRLGGAPLAEHGVGRNRIKQQLLRDLYGEAGIEAMRRVKRALDPQRKLAPGVLFDRN